MATICWILVVVGGLIYVGYLVILPTLIRTIGLEEAIKSQSVGKPKKVWAGIRHGWASSNRFVPVPHLPCREKDAFVYLDESHESGFGTLDIKVPCPESLHCTHIRMVRNIVGHQWKLGLESHHECLVETVLRE